MVNMFSAGPLSDQYKLLWDWYKIQSVLNIELYGNTPNGIHGGRN